MRQYYTFVRILKSGFVNLFRNAWLTIAATIVMVVALTIVLIAFVLNVTANNAINELALDLKAEIYLKDTISEQTLKNMRNDLNGLDIVASVEYVSQEQANQTLTQKYEEKKPELLQALALAGSDGNDALPSSLRVSVNDLERMTEIKTFAMEGEYADSVEDVSLGKDENSAQQTIDKAAAGQRFINTASVIAAGLLSLVSVMIIFNTIRMAIYTRRDEIRIMKLIGATPGYIRGPFIVEASLYGVFAGVFATGSTYSLILFLGKKVAEQKEFAQTYDFFTRPMIVAGMLCSAIIMGMLIGATSSMLALSRHLKLKDW